MNSKVIYTSIFGHIDSLLQPLAVDKDFDYLCFTDQKVGDIGIWKIVHIEAGTGDKVRFSRRFKLLPHYYLKDYDYSLYIDGNVRILDNEFYDSVNACIDENDLIAQLPHPTRDCIYLELEQCLNIRKITPLQYIRHRHSYSKTGLPYHLGLFENNVILRQHNNPRVIAISEMWWNEYCRISNRDQLSLMFVYWELKYTPALLLGKNQNTRNSKLIKCYHHKEEKVSCNEPLFTKARHYVEREIMLPIYRKIIGVKKYHSQW